MKSNKRVTWLATAVGTALAVLMCSLVVYGELGKTKAPQMSSAASGYPDAAPPSSVQSGGTTDNGVTYGGQAWGALRVGYTGKNKIIQDSSEVYISRLGSDSYGLIETNVTVKQTDEGGKVIGTVEGKALVFANRRDTANAGYVLVSPSEARTWVTVLNGNPDFVFNSSQSNIYPYTIEDIDTGKTLTAYNLADLAYKSGGKGDPPAGDGLTRIRNDLYLKRDGFIATPRPKCGISTDKTQYKVGETVNISYSCEAFSAYDNGVHIKELSVIHKETGQKWDYIIDDKVIRTSAGGSSARLFGATVNPKPAALLAVAPTGVPSLTPVEFVDANILPDTPHQTSQIPADVAQLPKRNRYLMVINNPPAEIPKAGENFASGEIMKIGWDTAVVALDDPSAKTNSPDQKAVAVASVIWDKLNVEKAYTQDGVNVVVASLKPADQLKPTYIDESGKIFAEPSELLLVFGKFGDPNKAQPMVFRKTDGKIFGVKEMDRDKMTITVREQIGEVSRTDQERIYFNLTIYPSLLGKELSIKHPNAPQ